MQSVPVIWRQRRGWKNKLIDNEEEKAIAKAILLILALLCEELGGEADNSRKIYH